MLVFGRVLILLIINHSFVTSSFKNATRPRFHSPEAMADYYDELDEPPSASPTDSEEPESDPCLYDLCVEQEKTCIDLALATGCLCPGLTGSQTAPSAPSLLKVSQEDGKGVVVYWCAPTSVVTHYIVRVASKDKDKVMERKLQVEDSKRAAVLGNVISGANICIQAVNNAGVSDMDDKSCAMFEPQTLDSGLALKLGILGGVVGILVVLILALLLWRHKKRQNSTAHRQKRSEAVL